MGCICWSSIDCQPSIIQLQQLDAQFNECQNGCCGRKPCLHGGTCRETCDVKMERFTCSCKPGFKGKYCETGKGFVLINNWKRWGDSTQRCYVYYKGFHKKGCFRLWKQSLGFRLTLVNPISRTRDFVLPQSICCMVVREGGMVLLLGKLRRMGKEEVGG